MSEQWETFCDVGYYHMWRLRRKTERGWNDGFHINTKAEAEALCQLLNKLEGERDEVLSDLEFRRDLFKLQEQQLNDVRAERDRLAEELDALKQSILDLSHPNMKLLLEERDELCEQRDRYKLACDKYSEDEILCKLQEVTEQRDRLAEALRCIAKGSHCLQCYGGDGIWIAEQALAAVKGGSDE